MKEKQSLVRDVDRSVIRQLNDIQRMPLSELRKKWVDLFGSDPGKLSKQYLIRRLAYRFQELTNGGLSQPTRDKLRSWAENPERWPRRQCVKKRTCNRGQTPTRLAR